MALELRAGVQHSAKETDYTLQRLLPRLASLLHERVLFRLDSGFDSAKIIQEMAAWQQPCDWIVKWNPRKFDKETCFADQLADSNTVWVSAREGKRQTTWIESTPDAHSPRRVMRLTERTIDKKGQQLLLPELEIEGWWTSLDWAAAEVIQSYCDHGTHEQFHSELKTDMDLERLPSGKFNTNDLVMALAMLTYNVLRHMGQGALLDTDAPIRHVAKRRRIKTVIQELILLAGRLSTHAGETCLGLSKSCAAYTVFMRYWQTVVQV